MKPAILTCEYLVAPAYCAVDNLDDFVSELASIKRALVDCKVVDLLIEDDALEKLAENDEYPTDQLFSRKFAEGDHDTYSARDVARTVHSILQRAETLTERKTSYEIEFGQAKFDPEIRGRTGKRKSELERIVREVCARNAYGSFEGRIIHACKIDKMNAVSCSIEVADMYPQNMLVPCDLIGNVAFDRTWRANLAALKGGDMYRLAANESDLKAAIFSAAGARMKVLGKEVDDLSLTAFDLGADFFDSLRRHQCSGSSAYASVTLATLADVLAGSPTVEINDFTTTAGGSVVRSSGNYLARRVHVTKSGIALRLLFWEDKVDKTIVFANVGPKSELYIAPPTRVDCL